MVLITSIDYSTGTCLKRWRLVLYDPRRHPVIIGESLLILVGYLGNLGWLGLRWAWIENQSWLCRNYTGPCRSLSVIILSINGMINQLHSLLWIHDLSCSHPSIDICNHLGYFLHILITVMTAAATKIEIRLCLLVVNHGQISIHSLRTALVLFLIISPSD